MNNLNNNKSNIILTEDQDKGLKLLQDFIDSKDSNFFLLKGYAGTGKSTLINEFISWYLLNKKAYMDELVITAPTNKAVKILKRLSKHPKADYRTLHSLLGVRPRIDENGVEVFEKDPKAEVSIIDYGCVIVDESSMIDDYIFDLLVEEAGLDLKIIFIGDAAQVPPVNMTQSKPFNPKVQEELNFKVFQLNEILRQARDNPIIRTSMEIRQGTFERKIEDSSDDKGHGVIQLNPKDKDKVYGYIREAFCGHEFVEDSDYAKVIAWRNVTVNAFNKLVRVFLYGSNATKIVENERLILNRPILGPNGLPILNVNDDLIVKTMTINSYTFSGKNINYYDCEAIKPEEPEAVYELKILHEDSEKLYNTILNTLRNIALKKPKKERANAWKKFYEFKDFFSDVTYSYAITVHKAQGSTYNKAFVCYSDIILNQKTVEMQRILYTACTRPSETLFII